MKIGRTSPFVPTPSGSRRAQALEAFPYVLFCDLNVALCFFKLISITSYIVIIFYNLLLLLVFAYSMSSPRLSKLGSRRRSPRLSCLTPKRRGRFKQQFTIYFNICLRKCVKPYYVQYIYIYIYIHIFRRNAKPCVQNLFQKICQTICSKYISENMSNHSSKHIARGDVRRGSPADCLPQKDRYFKTHSNIFELDFRQICQTTVSKVVQDIHQNKQVGKRSSRRRSPADFVPKRPKRRGRQTNAYRDR